MVVPTIIHSNKGDGNSPMEWGHQPDLQMILQSGFCSSQGGRRMKTQAANAAFLPDEVSKLEDILGQNASTRLDESEDK